MSKQHWTVEENGNYKSSPRSRAARDGAGLSGIILRYNPKPNPPRGEQDRPTSYSLNFPALALTDWVSQPALAAGQIARALNSHGPMVEALKRARQFIENGVELGFIAFSLILPSPV